jgi:hypothetical protein
MKVSQAVNYYLDYHKMNSKKNTQGIKGSSFPGSSANSVLEN